MKIFDLLCFEHHSNLNVPNASIIEEILNEIITPELEKIGLTNKKYKYKWSSDYNVNGIKTSVRFHYRGLSAGFTIGQSFKCIPSTKILKYPKDKFHLFEHVDFFNTNKKLSLWNRKIFEIGLKKFISKDLKKIRKHIVSCDSIQKNIDIALRQINSTRSEYEIHDPDQKYVLAFLYATLGDKEKAQNTMKEYAIEKNLVHNDLFKYLENV
ncbi:hypothetical protein [uncultured Dokdonia sp.]|uniref:hypothetical protein n=1 Tax=uncultured Dokdonia sp. TaxID=575653 RepID=UPI0026371E45|nr:hypothetical protein [uncultured Dokdonia sp.]